MNRKGCLYPFFAIFAIAGLISGAIGAVSVYNRYRLTTEGVKAVGKVIDLNYNKNMSAPVIGFTDTRGRSIVYHSTLYSSTNDHEIGDEIELHYLPDDPDEVALEGEGWTGWIPFIFLFTHGGAGIGGLIWLERQRRLRKWLLEYGHSIEAKFTGVEEQHHKGNTSYYIVCSWKDPYTQEEYTFKSDALREYPVITLGASIPVLIDPANPKRHLVQREF